MAYVIDREILGKPKEKYWISYIKQRINNNKNFLGFISGQTGSGKSYSSLRICEELDNDFSIERVVFSGLDLMELINSNKLKRGSAICFEEVGVEMNSKNWASKTNKMLNYLIQTFRHKGFILIMNSPYMDFVDAGSRKLFHAELSTIKIDYSTKEVFLKPQLIQYNSRNEKFYYKRLKVITPIGKIPVSVWRVGLPTDKLRLEYEIKKSEYTSKLNKKILSELQAYEDKTNRKNEITEIQSEILELIKDGMNVEQIAKARNRSEYSIFASIKLLKNKGYQFKPIFDEENHRKVLRYEVFDPNSQISGIIRTHTPNKLNYEDSNKLNHSTPPIPRGAIEDEEGL